MRLLNNTEINNVSGAVIDFGNGVGLQVSSVGIPPNAYSFIDTVQNQVFKGKITTTEAAIKIFNAGYANYFNIWHSHIEKGNYTLVLI